MMLQQKDSPSIRIQTSPTEPSSASAANTMQPTHNSKITAHLHPSIFIVRIAVMLLGANRSKEFANKRRDRTEWSARSVSPSSCFPARYKAHVEDAPRGLFWSKAQIRTRFRKTGSSRSSSFWERVTGAKSSTFEKLIHLVCS